MAVLIGGGNLTMQRQREFDNPICHFDMADEGLLTLPLENSILVCST